MDGNRLMLLPLEDLAIRYYLRKKAYINQEFDYQSEYAAVAANPDKVTKLVAEYKKYAQIAD